jgi:hypothetical protein
MDPEAPAWNLGPMHTYESDPQSGAGNCTCGGAREHHRHPHDFRRAWSAARGAVSEYCVCGQAPEALIHLAALSVGKDET